MLPPFPLGRYLRAASQPSTVCNKGIRVAAYHLGYSDFRSSQLRSPVVGDVAWSIPTLVTLNPIGAPIAHAGLHTSAVLHSYETDLFLPPHE